MSWRSNGGEGVWRGSVLLLLSAGGRSDFVYGRTPVLGVSSPRLTAVVHVAARLPIFGLGGRIPAASGYPGAGAAGWTSSSSPPSPGVLAE